MACWVTGAIPCKNCLLSVATSFKRDVLFLKGPNFGMPNHCFPGHDSDKDWDLAGAPPLLFVCGSFVARKSLHC